MARIDALDKVTGAKVFARDLRAPDVVAVAGEDWGVVTWRATLLRAAYLDRTFDGIAVEVVAGYGARRCFVREGTRLVDVVGSGESFTVEFGFGLFGAEPAVDLFVDTGSAAVYAGQPVALVVFDDVARFVDAERELAELAVRYGPASGSVPVGHGSGGVIGAALVAWCERGEVPARELLYGGEGTRVGSGPAPRHRSLVRSFERGRVVSLRTSTPTVDPAFLEPDSCLGRVQRRPDGKWAVTVFVPSQSPATDAQNIAGFLGSNTVPSAVRVWPMSLGGGFGGRDFSVFPLYGALAALVGQGTPVRLSVDRMEQFASGTKRHASVVDLAVAFDDDGRLLAVRSKLIMDGGSQKDLTTSVKGLALHSSAGAYRFDHWELRGLAMRSRGPLAGSMRGFGIPQVLFAVEQAIDQVAYELGVDPVALRRQSVVRRGDEDVDEQVLYHDVRNLEVLDAVAGLPLWQQRDQGRVLSDGRRRGVGFALAMEAFGTTSDGAAVAVTLSDAGELVVTTEVIEMGQGAGTGLAAVFAAAFGASPDRVEVGQVQRLGAPIANRPKTEIAFKQGTTSASKTIFFHGHVLEEATAIWWRRVWLPAAAIVWNRPLDQLDPTRMVFDAGRALTHPGLPPIPWATLAAAVLADGRSRVWAHGSFHGVWTFAEFRHPNGDTDAVWLDALALTTNQQWPRARDLVAVTRRVLPTDPRYGTTRRPTLTQRSVYASSGLVVEVAVDPVSGAVEVTDAVYVLDAGDRADDDLVAGQVEGGFAQGLGFALTEQLPSGPVAGQRLWNFDAYALPRLHHLPTGPVRTVYVELPPDAGVLGPIGVDDPAPPPRQRKKGIAEISITPVAPAVANAIFHALADLPAGGTPASRLVDLPISAAAVRHAATVAVGGQP